MKHIIVGTAGHVDHGKTTLIKALTKIDTDRLKEEQKRGISIEIGFAYFDLPSGKRVGLIDVPGHERFIKNMLAGVGGIDAVILVIAADEGVMPQTQEHLDIISLLQVKKGVVALTKADMVEPDWLELMEEEVREKLVGSFLEEAAIIPFSAHTGLGLDELIAEVDRLSEEVESKDPYGQPRLPIDRVFSISGFGTVVTGTLVSGNLNLGDRLEVVPGNLTTRVRSLQVHGEKTERAFAGQRVAVNLAGLEVNDISRGQVLAKANTLKTTLMLDARVEVLAGAIRPLQHRTRVRLYIGSSEVMGRVVPLEAETIEPGQNGLVQLRLEEPVAAVEGDLFILRYYSPMTTLGGGRVLKTNPQKITRFKTKQVEMLKALELGTPEHRFLQALQEVSPDFPERSAWLKTHSELVEGEEMLEELLQTEQALSFTVDRKEILLAFSYYQEISLKVEELLKTYHQKNPLRLGMPKEELRSRIGLSIGGRTYAAFLLLLESDGHLKQFPQYLAALDFDLNLNETQKNIYESIKNRYLEAEFEPPNKSELQEEFGKFRDFLPLMDLLVEEDFLIRLSEDIYYPKEVLDRAEDILLAWFKENEEITLAEYRDLISSSRKYALALMEYFDSQRITLRQGEKRILRVKI